MRQINDSFNQQTITSTKVEVSWSPTVNNALDVIYKLPPISHSTARYMARDFVKFIVDNESRRRKRSKKDKLRKFGMSY